MSTQNYANHRRTDPGFHFVLFGLIVLTLGGSIANLIRAVGRHSGISNASLIVMLTVIVALLAGFCRMYALKAQDRAIRAEEICATSFSRVSCSIRESGSGQVIALRFAPDEEFAALARRAAEEGLAPDPSSRR